MEGNPVNFLDPFGLDEYKVDTSTAHNVAMGLGIIAMAAGIFVTSTAMAVVALVAGVAVSGFDTGLYINDAIEADTPEERNSALSNAALSVATIGSGTITQITRIVYSVNSYKVLTSKIYYYFKQVLDFITNVASGIGV